MVFVALGMLKPAGSEESLEQLPNMLMVFVTFGALKPSGSLESLEQP